MVSAFTYTENIGDTTPVCRQTAWHERSDVPNLIASFGEAAEALQTNPPGNRWQNFWCGLLESDVGYAPWITKSLMTNSS